jgi:hypothetical protein
LHATTFELFCRYKKANDEFGRETFRPCFSIFISSSIQLWAYAKKTEDRKERQMKRKTDEKKEREKERKKDSETKEPFSPAVISLLRKKHLCHQSKLRLCEEMTGIGTFLQPSKKLVC